MLGRGDRMIGIRREDKNQWERRVALTPDHVSELKRRADVRFNVQPSEKRAFSNLDFERAGASLDETLDDCPIIFGIKEIPPDKLVRDKVYFFFSHTTKGQPANMPMLRRLLDLGCTLVDYELIVGDDGRRLVFFGRHAGYAGMIDTLWALGKRLDARGVTTPLERVRLAHDYTSLDEATNHISRIGETIRHNGLPSQIEPFVCGFTGSGNVSLGAQEIYDRLPVVTVRPQELAGLADDPSYPQNVLYKVHFRREDRVERIGGGPIDTEEMSEYPDRYRNRMVDWLPYLTVLINGTYWEPPQPRLVSNDDLAELWQRPDPKLELIADITFDVHGSIESTIRATTPDEPTYLWDAQGRREIDGWVGGDDKPAGPLILAVDNLPCQLSAEASEHFGDTLLRFVPKISGCDWTRPLDQLDLPDEIRRAIIAHQGVLTSEHEHLTQHLDSQQEAHDDE